MTGLVSPKKRLILLAGFLLAFLTVFNFSTFVLYQRAKAYLDAELGERLRSIGLSLSHTIELAMPDSLSPEGVGASAYALLLTAKTENLLSNIVILTPQGSTIVDLMNYSAPGEINPFIDLDFSAVTLARSGLSAYTSLYRSGNIYMKSAYAPIESSNGRVIGIVGVEAGASYFEVLRALGNAIILVDVTSLIVIVVLGWLFYRQSVSLDRAQAAALRGENLATMGRMVAGVAHDIRNPLSIIKTSAERIQKKYNITDEVFTYISEEVDQLNRILTGYLDFARAERREVGDVALARVFRRCLMILEPEFNNKSIRISENFPKEELVVSGDDKRIQQAILNVLINAIQAVGDGGRIEMSLSKQGNSAVVVVGDDGMGISEKNLKEVTKPFFTTKKHGSGLGLSIVRNVVEEHGGTLRIESEPSRGTRVSIFLPLAIGG